jgi:NTE family protein
MGIPAVFPPVQWGDRWLTDGGIVTPLPTGPLRDAGIATVIASNVAGQDPDVRATPDRAPRLVETLGRIVSAMEREVLGPEVALADVQVRPVVRAANSFDFRHVEDYLAEGERAAREALPAIHSALEI